MAEFTDIACDAVMCHDFCVQDTKLIDVCFLIDQWSLPPLPTGSLTVIPTVGYRVQ